MSSSSSNQAQQGSRNGDTPLDNSLPPGFTLRLPERYRRSNSGFVMNNRPRSEGVVATTNQLIENYRAEQRDPAGYAASAARAQSQRVLENKIREARKIGIIHSWSSDFVEHHIHRMREEHARKNKETQTQTQTQDTATPRQHSELDQRIDEVRLGAIFSNSSEEDVQKRIRRLLKEHGKPVPMEDNTIDSDQAASGPSSARTSAESDDAPPAYVAGIGHSALDTKIGELRLQATLSNWTDQDLEHRIRRAREEHARREVIDSASAALLESIIQQREQVRQEQRRQVDAMDERMERHNMEQEEARREHDLRMAHEQAVREHNVYWYRYEMYQHHTQSVPAVMDERRQRLAREQDAVRTEYNLRMARQQAQRERQYHMNMYQHLVPIIANLMLTIWLNAAQSNE